MPSLEDTIALASRAHAGQVDKLGEPYILHPLRVMLRLRGNVERIVGVLHDVVEDTSITLDDLRHLGYPELIVQAVDALTRRDEGEESYDQYIDRLRNNPIARAVKFADLEDNMDTSRLPRITEQTEVRLARYRRACARLQEGDSMA